MYSTCKIKGLLSSKIKIRKFRLKSKTNRRIQTQKNTLRKSEGVFISINFKIDQRGLDR